MKVYAVYIISADGRPMVNEVYQSPDSIPVDALLSALLTTLQIVSSDLIKVDNAAEMFKLKGVTYHLRNFESFYIALVTDGEDLPSHIMNQIGWQFLQEYNAKINAWVGAQSDFFIFKEKIKTILSKNARIDESKSIQPSKILDPIQMLKLDKSLKNTAKSILFHSEASIDEICEYSGEGRLIVEANLNSLINMGYLGYFERNGENIYFC